MEVQGTIIKIGETEIVGQKGFKKRQIVIKTNTQYPQSIPVDFTQDKCIMLDKYVINQYVKISVNIQGNEWQGKYYLGFQGWKIEHSESEKSANAFMPDRQSDSAIHNLPNIDYAEDDSPF